MKLFHIGDVLSITTGRLVSPSHMDGVCSILAFMTGDDNLFTHALPRVADECKPWLRVQYPQLFANDWRGLALMIEALDKACKETQGDKKLLDDICQFWCGEVARTYKLPMEIPVEAIGEGMHLRIDPVEEAKAMIGDDKVIPISAIERRD